MYLQTTAALKLHHTWIIRLRLIRSFVHQITLQCIIICISLPSPGIIKWWNLWFSSGQVRDILRQNSLPYTRLNLFHRHSSPHPYFSVNYSSINSLTLIFKPLTKSYIFPWQRLKINIIFHAIPLYSTRYVNGWARFNPGESLKII